MLFILKKKKNNIEEFKGENDNIKNYFKEDTDPLFIYLSSKRENDIEIQTYLIIKRGRS